ncbi:MAG: acetyl-CoA decarbonylase/synthase complex subunit delta [Candidatus Omnitrophica bacterium]|nr:acetyl-CoA decarbonylase/synthase complex subunit delta [Candidatus Omnitrophota bacterium]MDD5352569.1 acetyl-CoA decarbonylase/synthase complex subunit delta [Candidatus Omnitrophota bacterium]MDD5550167.1 acetyl-CoA decarbonylase/synthase complex subunit delta [Candidatus Omnitrophota bacterium]
MLKELAQEKWSAKINTVTIGATKNEGGTRSSNIKIGGQATLPFIFSDGEIPHRPVIAAEVWDIAPIDWSPSLDAELKDVYSDPVLWSKKAIDKIKADLICLRLQGAHPDFGNRSPEQEAKLVREIISKTSLPLIVVGCGDDAKDNLVLPACAEAARGERCLFGSAAQENYKTLVGACLADGHNIIAESPIDINIAKQLNILIHEMGFALDKIVINPTVGALGYGLEYAYSIMERARLAALTGDKMLAQPFICFVGSESWRAKEAKATMAEYPQWGKELERGVVWEALTATTFLQSGADILVMRHPRAIDAVRQTIDKLMER